MVIMYNSNGVESPVYEYRPSSTPQAQTKISRSMDSNIGNFGLDINSNRISKVRSYIIVCILFAINLLNYMDRFTIAAVLIDIQNYFGINDATAGLLQTSFICAYMILAPVFGYLGDRYSRKLIMIVGIFIWISAVLLSTFVDRTAFWAFILLRGVVGVGEASYSTVSPTIIADLFTNDQRSIMLMLFYFAIPVGSGLGFVAGDAIARAFKAWQWGIRLTPIFGTLCLLLLIIVLKEPVRGGAEVSKAEPEKRALKIDLIYLMKNKSFMWSTMGFVCVSFVSGAIAFWTPNFIRYSRLAIGENPEGIPIKFGAITCLAGFLGVTIGSVGATKWRKTNGKADPLVCALGLAVCLPFYVLAINFSNNGLFLILTLVFIAITGLCLNWAVVSDILMYVVIPACRSSANAVQLLIGHLLGDAFSPYSIGLVSDWILGSKTSNVDHYNGLKYALYIPVAMLAIGIIFFLITAWFIEADKQSATDAMNEAVTLELDKSINNNINSDKSSPSIDSINGSTSSAPVFSITQELELIEMRF